MSTCQRRSANGWGREYLKPLGYQRSGGGSRNIFEINWVYQHHKNKYPCEVLQFLSIIKEKKKTIIIIRDKVRTKNAEMRVIKWESLKWY